MESLRRGYGHGDLQSDLLAGITVGIIALPLSMALAISSGVAPQHGLYTAIIAGALIALTGGSRLAVSGPTAAFVVVLAPIAQQHGVGGLLLATLMAGIFLVALGLAGLGRLIQFIPYPVTTGFTTGIAVVIATLQVKDFFGLRIEDSPAHFLDKVAALATAAPSARLAETVLGAATLGLLLLWPRVMRRVPGALAASLLGGGYAWWAAHYFPAGAVDTIGSRFSFVAADGTTTPGIPALAPSFLFPWNQPGADGAPFGFSWELLRALSGPALAIGLLGAIESLLCAVVADGMAGSRHDPDRELIGQGLGNIVAPFFGGIAATAALARTAANFRAGARSPLSAIFHSLFLLAAMLLLAPLLAWLPMASMAALLLVVAWNMSEVRHFAFVLRTAPRSDVVVLLACFGLTVIFDMVVAITVGVVLAALLFMRRTAALTESRVLREGHHDLPVAIPQGVLAYEIAGSFFFGASERAINSLREALRAEEFHTVVLRLEAVPMMDVTGLVALESVLRGLQGRGVRVVLAGLTGQPRDLVERFLAEAHLPVVLAQGLEEGLEQAKQLDTSGRGSDR